MRGTTKVWGGVNVVARVAVAALLAVAGTGCLQAQSLRKVTYAGGTTIPGSGLHGQLSVASPEMLVFNGSQRVVIPYDRMISFESGTRKRVHVGLLTEGLWRLLAPWPEARQLSLSYLDAGDHTQVIVLEMSQGDERFLVEVLKTRVPRFGGRLLPTPENNVISPPASSRQPVKS